MISAEEYKELLKDPNRPTGGFEEGPELTDHDEEVLDRVWAENAADNGVVQLPDQPSEEEIRAMVE